MRNCLATKVEGEDLIPPPPSTPQTPLERKNLSYEARSLFAVVYPLAIINQAPTILDDLFLFLFSATLQIN